MKAFVNDLSKGDVQAVDIKKPLRKQKFASQRYINV